MEELISVSQLTHSIKEVLEESFDSVKIVGEISNFKAHVSGHWYFTLKDDKAQINCTMWRGINNYVYFTPQDGMKVIVTGRVTVYPPRGSYQFDVRSMKPAGIGELQAAFEKLKQDLADEGLFDVEYKKPIPRIPNKIGIVTAIDGAALKDMISVAQRRFPLVKLVVASSKVQGEGAADEIAANILALNKHDDIDVIIVGRGGGSLEDLWCFNEEKVARAIFKSDIPVISAVGHEIDFTIADFVADLRAPTPTAAMELATPDKNEIFAFINDFLYTSTDNISSVIDNFKSSVDNILGSYGFRVPRDLIRNRAQFLDNIIYRIDKSIARNVGFSRSQIDLLSQNINSYNVDKILQKGFVLVRQENKLIGRHKELNQNKPFLMKFFDNEIEIKNYDKEKN